MAARRPCWSLSDVPIEVVIDIDLHRLRATCRLMLCACGDRAIGVRLSFLQCWEKMSWSQSSKMHALLHQLLSRTIVSGLNVAAYLCTLFLYRNDGGTTDHDIARMYIRHMEGEGEDGCKRSDPLPPAPILDDFPCARGACSKAKGWPQIRLFCSEDCRIRYEIVVFVSEI
uniref:Uncharacterized protein n=1 Tax=Setaria viridis TaxID=4556 RepID=A0A4V6D6I9_SETVI|nr:hypothetical protein SEVIR_5G175200v2 [Setaria viridis]